MTFHLDQVTTPVNYSNSFVIVVNVLALKELANKFCQFNILLSIFIEN